MTIYPAPKPSPRTKKPRKPLPRATKPIAKSGKPKPRNAKRAKANHARAYGGEYADYIRSLPCCNCGITGRTVAAHSRTGGMGRKSDAKWLVPLCCNGPMPYDEFGKPRDGCHELIHLHGPSLFNIDLKAKAAELWAEWHGVSASRKNP